MTFTVTEVVTGPCVFCGRGTETAMPDMAVCAGCWTVHGYTFEVTDNDPTGKPSKVEERWLEQKAEEEQRGSTKGVRRPEKIAEKMLLTASKITTATRNATAVLPPSNENSPGTRRSKGPSDPVAAQVGNTFAAIERAFARMGHIIDDCAICYLQDAPLSCNPNLELDMTLARLTGEDYTELADLLVGGLSPMAPPLVGEVTAQVDIVFARSARAAVEIWHDMYQRNVESQHLRDYFGQIVEVTRRLTALSGVLAQWIPGGVVRVCKNRDCRRPAPPLAAGAVERGGAQCRPCIDARSKARTGAA